MELKEGMYVRTQNNGIAKIKSFHSNIYDDYICISHCFDLVRKKEITRASNNIIDLIEVGDYVNGKDVWFNEDFNCLVVGDNEYYMPISYDNFLSRYGVEKIETIVTKEQFESMSYKMEE